MKRVLFICSRNRRRSPTAEVIFSAYEGIEVESAGVERDAEITVDRDAVRDADIIFVMERTHQRKLLQQFGSELKHKRVVCLDIRDRYAYMEPALVALLRRKVCPLLGISD